MGTGKWPDATLKRLHELARDVPGDYAEIGCLNGHATQRLAWLAGTVGKRVHAFDSFRGCSPPGEFDGERYREGRLDCGGVPKFLERIGDEARAVTATHEGFVPRCFEDAHDERFALVLLDLDMHDPTAIALQWVESRTRYLAVDDLIPGQDLLAARAIRRWMGDREPVNLGNDQALFDLGAR